MYAMLSIFKLGPGTGGKANAMGEPWLPVLSGMKGFKSATMIGDYDEGEYIGLTLWETKADAEAVLADTEEHFQAQIGSIAIEPPTRKIYDVWKTF